MKKYHLSKRIFDILFALKSILIFLPFFILIILSVLLSSGRPIFYKSQRIGKNKKIFTAYKFRTLVNNAKELQQNKGYRMNPPDERLITPIGKILRATHFDELPQLFNILKGDITFIGPRPLDTDFYKRYVKKNKHWGRILQIKPGLTGLNQVCRYHPLHMHKILKKCGKLNKLPKRRRILLDLYYLKNESLSLDMVVVYWTARLFFTRIFEIFTLFK
ncbi:sugar transferase [Candidatus Woesearchaeota archaeon]|nr:sugar transferase [Candidatus Woesearchaeota archaeon]